MANKGYLLIIPGFMGSQLRFSTRLFGFHRHHPLWLDYLALGIGGYVGLGLDATGLHNLIPSMADLSPGGPLPSYYAPVVSYFAQSGYSIFSVNMDWRQDIQLDAMRIYNVLIEVGNRAPINVLCHSRGGLVMRRVLGLLAAGGRLGLIGRIAGFGVPHSGTLEATKGLAGWGQPLSNVLSILDAIPHHQRIAFLGDVLRLIFRTWPSLYQLQPAPTAGWLNPGDTTTLYSPAAWAPFAPPVSQAWLAAAANYWATLRPAPAGVEWCDVIGYSWITPRALAAPQIPRGAPGLTYTPQGDGVVVQAAAQLGVGPSIMAPTQHSSLCSDGRIFRYVDQWFQGQLTTNVLIEGQRVGSQ